MGFWPAPPAPPPVAAARFDVVGTGASLCIILCALLCVYNAWRSDSLPSSGLALHLAGFLVNVVSVAVPGRFDSDVDPKSMNFPWPTLFSPAGFAFAIWGVIYLGETAGLVALARAPPELAAQAAPASRAWLCANVAQALWCAAFRPWALDRLWLSSLCLAATAASLVLSQLRLTADLAAAKDRAAVLVALVTWPRSLHAGWVTAASLVNLNAWAGMAAVGPARSLAVVVLSLMGAGALADLYAASGLSCAAAAIAWALFAVSKGEPNGKDALALGQHALDGLAIASAATAALAALAVVVRQVF